MFELIKSGNTISQFDSFVDEILNNRYMHSNEIYFSDDEKGYYIEIALPGFSKNDIEINVNEKFIEITSLKEKENNKTFWKKSFYKRIQIPKDVKNNDIHASLKNGILSLILHRMEKKTMNRTIEIK